MSDTYRMVIEFDADDADEYDAVVTAIIRTGADIIEEERWEEFNG